MFDRGEYPDLVTFSARSAFGGATDRVEKAQAAMFRDWHPAEPKFDMPN